MNFARTFSARAWMVRIVTILALLATVSLIPAEKAAAGHESCSNNAITRVEKPVNNGGVHVRGHVYCTESLDRLALTVYLFFCGNTQPQQNETYVQNNCTLKASNTISLANTLANHDYTLWAPPIGTQGPTAKGWYIGCELVGTTDTHNGSQLSTNFFRTGSPLLRT